jgi:hypothetical protein
MAEDFIVSFILLVQSRLWVLPTGQAASPSIYLQNFIQLSQSLSHAPGPDAEIEPLH